jgi:hypothetical protein
MTMSYKEAFGIVSFRDRPADRHQRRRQVLASAVDEWVDCPGSTGIGVDVLWSGDCTAIPAA